MDPALAFEVEEVSRNRIINETIAKGNSDVQRFYENKVIFVTGGSGFLGKQLIEKLLRSCNCKKIYILMRPKKQKAIHERLSKIFEDPPYDVLKKIKPDFLNKIVPVIGDVEQLNIGLSEEDRSMLIQEVNIVFHIAATTKFTDPLKKATIINIRGTREVLNLGEECKHLIAFIHVSTAYIAATENHIGQEIKECPYEDPVSPAALIQFAETLDETKLNEITPMLIKGFPNTYTFTKRVAESLVRQKEGKMPIAVIRPGIVIGAYREPSPGWIDMNAILSVSGTLQGIGLGIIHVSMTGKYALNFVPVDLVNNATIVAAFHTNKRWNNGQTDINNIAVVDTRNPITRKKIVEIMERDGPKICTDMVVYHPFYINTQNIFLYYILTWILHTIPGYLVDAVLLLLGKQPILSKVYKKLYNLTIIGGYFMVQNWKFNDDKLVNMYQTLSPTDRIIYNCDIQDLNWERFVIIWAIGLRKYIVKDGLKHTTYATKKMEILRIIHYIVTPLYLYLLWKVFTLSLFVVGTLFSFFHSSLLALNFN